jgi:hypothetical protein
MRVLIEVREKTAFEKELEKKFQEKLKNKLKKILYFYKKLT